MGGSNSGRYRTRNRGTVDAAIRLDIRAMRRQGFIRPGAVTSGVLHWTWTATGEETGSVNITVNLTATDYGSLTVRFSLNGEPRVQEVDLIGRPMKYGGRRYYFRCPKHHSLCEVLPMVGGVFGSRRAQRLTYQSQSSTQIDRLREKALKLEKRLWPGNGKCRPRGRNRERLTAAWEAADSGFEYLFAATVMRRWGGAL